MYTCIYKHREISPVHNRAAGSIQSYLKTYGIIQDLMWLLWHIRSQLLKCQMTGIFHVEVFDSTSFSRNTSSYDGGKDTRGGSPFAAASGSPFRIMGISSSGCGSDGGGYSSVSCGRGSLPAPRNGDAATTYRGGSVSLAVLMSFSRAATPVSS